MIGGAQIKSQRLQMSDYFNNWTIIRQLPAFFAGVAVCAFIDVSNTPDFLAANARTIATKIDEGTPQPVLKQELSDMGERACVFKGKDDARYVIVVPRGEQNGIVEAGKALVDKNVPTGLVGRSLTSTNF
jgi:hypothetical protein